MVTKQPLLLFPCNGNAIEALDAALNSFEVIGFVDDSAEKQRDGWNGYRVMGRSAFNQFPEAKVLAVPGSPANFKMRKQIIDDLGLSDDRWATVVHPSAQLGIFTSIGHNTLIMAGVVVTSNAQIGNHVCVLPNSVIHHDVVVGDYTLIGSGTVIAGYSLIGDRCYIGSKSSIINNIQIGDGSLIGIGSNVISSFGVEEKIVGNPAKSILKK